MSTMSDLDLRVQELEALGFEADIDTAAEDYGHDRYLRIRCNSCEALVINGVPCHETGCRNATRECSGCTNRIPALRFRRFCDDCQ